MAPIRLSGLEQPLRRVEAGTDAPGDPSGGWPYGIPAVRSLLADGLDLGRATVLVGENGSGKSTLVEAIAEAYGLNVEGGSTGARHATRRTESPLASDLRLVRGAAAARGGYFLRAETMHAFFSYLEQVGMASFHHLSHGESFLALIGERFFDRRGRPRPGLYVLDEPESALSYASSIQALGFLSDLLAAPGTQVVMATHSPVLAALPGASIVELSDAGLRPTAWEDLDLVVNLRYFLADPRRVLRHLADADAAGARVTGRT